MKNPFEGKAVKFDTAEQLIHLSELARGYGLEVQNVSPHSYKYTFFRLSSTFKHYSNYANNLHNDTEIHYSDFVASIKAVKFADSITKDAPELTNEQKVVGMYPNSVIVYDTIKDIRVYKVRFGSKETGFYKTQDEAWATAYDMIVADTLALKPDMVNNPPHYTVNGIEVIDVIKGYKLCYLLGNVIKYVLRCNFKGNKKQDLQKAAWYLNRAISELE